MRLAFLPVNTLPHPHLFSKPSPFHTFTICTSLSKHYIHSLLYFVPLLKIQQIQFYEVERAVYYAKCSSKHKFCTVYLFETCGNFYKYMLFSMIYIYTFIHELYMFYCVSSFKYVKFFVITQNG